MGLGALAKYIALGPTFWNFAKAALFFFNPATGLNFSGVFEVYKTFDLTPFGVPKTFDLGHFQKHKTLDLVIFVLSKK